jgi:hypothetical protein
MAEWLKRGALADQKAAIDAKVRETVEVTLSPDPSRNRCVHREPEPTGHYRH